MDPRYVNPKYVYSELSGEIIDCCSKVQNRIGAGRLEKSYHQALFVEFRNRDLRCQSEVWADLKYEEEKVGKRRFDFIIDSKIVVGIKVKPHPSQNDFQQIRDYLGISGYQLGLLILFTFQGVKVYRVPNINLI